MEAREYLAELLRPRSKRPIRHRVQARTPQLAAILAEGEVAGAQCVSVSATWQITGRCGGCGQPIFDDDQVRYRNSSPRCFDCG